ncbi:hypothetical protein BcepF1.049 [Burkholderia phage BcepF1]|uniref:Uncharacterized protein n=1 Tax=Burkholderia phage BcepF1 TaxID=2886897 RepID=A1YZV3_9CAUD|nr:hypothetical protein BcepF1.049 [Burkholderia phage BcepF1]ABL96780.1 hypothetical protein BcepF1.049 [Burkholderia phage BcepF1]
MNYCKDCNNYRSILNRDLCTRGRKVETVEDMVRGPIETVTYEFSGTARDHRMDESIYGCGPEARFFVPISIESED